MKKLYKTSLTIIKFVFITALLIVPDALYCQGVGIGNANFVADPSSILELKSITQGVLIPRMTTAQRNDINPAAEGLLIFNTVTKTYDYYSAVVPAGWKSIDATVVTNANLTGEITSVGNAAILGSFTSASLSTALTDETGTGTSVFSVAPTFTGVPLAPTAVVGTNTDQLATTAFVLANTDGYSSVNSTSVEYATSQDYELVPDMTVTPSLGTYAVNFNSQCDVSGGIRTETITTASLKIDVGLIIADIAVLDPDPAATVPALALANVTIEPGFIDVGGAISVDGKIILDGLDQENPVFVFRAFTSIGVLAGAEIELINGAKSSHVFWVGASFGMGASAIFKGTVCTPGIITVGVGCTVDGRLLSEAGAIGFGGSISIPADSPPDDIDMRGVASFVLFSGGGILTNAGASVYTGNVGTGAGAITSFNLATVTGTIFYPGPTLTSFPVYHQASFSIFKNADAIVYSERHSIPGATSSIINLHAIVTVNGGDVITVKWKTDALVSDGKTVAVTNRVLTLINVR
jgi:hypothetical protein